MSNKIPPDDTSATAAKSGKTATTPGHRPHLRSDGSPPPLTTPAAPPMARPTLAPDEYSGQLSDPSNDEGSPSLLSEPISTGFQMVTTPIGRCPTLPVAAISPPTMGNSFSALDDSDDPPCWSKEFPPPPLHPYPLDGTPFLLPAPTTPTWPLSM